MYIKTLFWHFHAYFKHCSQRRNMTNMIDAFQITVLYVRSGAFQFPLICEFQSWIYGTVYISKESWKWLILINQFIVHCRTFYKLFYDSTWVQIIKNNYKHSSHSHSRSLRLSPQNLIPCWHQLYLYIACDIIHYYCHILSSLPHCYRKEPNPWYTDPHLQYFLCCGSEPVIFGETSLISS